MTTGRLWKFIGALLVASLAGQFGCIERKLTITSEPAGAIVRLNDREIGATPVTVDFTFYGDFDVSLHKDGYETYLGDKRISSPWWDWPGIDFFTSISPQKFRDHQQWHFQLAPVKTVSRDVLVARARALRSQTENPPPEKK